MLHILKFCGSRSRSGRSSQYWLCFVCWVRQVDPGIPVTRLGGHPVVIEGDTCQLNIQASLMTCPISIIHKLFIIHCSHEEKKLALLAGLTVFFLGIFGLLAFQGLGRRTPKLDSGKPKIFTHERPWVYLLMSSKPSWIWWPLWLNAQWSNTFTTKRVQ